MRRFASVATGLFACVTGCGDDGGARKLPDAPLVEDGPAPDMLASGTVNVTTMVRCCDVAANTPQANVLVVAGNVDGQIASTATTDAQGQATLTIREGATVTAIYPEDANQETIAVSYVGVKPDDNLTYGDGYYTLSQTITGVDGQLVLNWPAVTGATQYRVYHPCENYGPYVNGLTRSLPLYTYCQTANAPIAVIALDASYRVVSSVYLPAAAYAPGTLTLVANQWVNQAADNYTASISGLPAAVDDVGFGLEAAYAGFSYTDNEYVTPKSGGGTAMLSVPSTATATTIDARLSRNSYRQQEHYKRGPSPVVFPAPTLPWLSGVIFNAEERHAVWLQTMGTYDASILGTRWRRTDGKIDHYYRWRVILPPGVTEFSVGTPPAELEPYLPGAADDVEHELTLVDLSSAASYDAARALPEWRLASARGAVATGDEPLAGITSHFDGGEGLTFNH